MNVQPFRPLPGSGILYHYTTRAWAQEISMTGEILPISGYVYLTDVLFKIGWQATDYLALPNTNAEMAIPISTTILEHLGLQYLGVVPEWQARGGRSMRRGGGHQWVVSQPIPVQILPWTWIELESP